MKVYVFLGCINFFAYPKSVDCSQLSVDFLWRSGYRRRAFRYIFARSAIASLAKDAAPIPNALGAANSKSLSIKNDHRACEVICLILAKTQRNAEELFIAHGL